MSGPPPAAADDEAAPLGPAPLGPAEVEALLAVFAPFERAPRLAVAVSGGPDSMALALLAAAWAESRGGSVTGLTVDHGLRPASAAEAAQVAAWLAARGIPCRRLVWEGPKPRAGVQAAARAARYRLLTDACRAEGILHLLLAHQREDQAETVAIRARRQSGPSGLAGMAAVVETQGLRLLRPFLAVPKRRLIATLVEFGQPWLDDPGNLAACFERGRLRRDPGFDPAAHWRCGLVQAEARAGRDRELARFFAAHARPHPLGFVRLDRPAWAALPPSLRHAALARAIIAINATDYLPSSKTMRYAIAMVDEAAPFRRLTLAGCVLEADARALRAMREPGRIAERAVLRVGERCRWDGRFLVRYRAGDGLIELRPLGREGRRLLPASVRERLRRTPVPAAAIEALPGAWRGASLLACPPLAAYGFDAAADVAVEVRHDAEASLAGPPFAGANIVSNPDRLIYRACPGSVPGMGMPAAGACWTDAQA